MEGKFKSLCEELDSARERVSKLTSENAALETTKNDLTGRIEELIAQKGTAESISAELVQEKQLSDTERGTKRINFQYTLFTLLFMLFRNRTESSS